MALTVEQFAKSRQYLGYPAVFKFANPRLESALQLVSADPQASVLAAEYIAAIDDAITAFDAAISTAGLRTLDKDDVGFFESNSAISGAAAQGRARVTRLSILLGVPVANDIFGGGGYLNDKWRAGNGRVKLMGLG